MKDISEQILENLREIERKVDDLKRGANGKEKLSCSSSS